MRTHRIGTLLVLALMGAGAGGPALGDQVAEPTAPIAGELETAPQPLEPDEASPGLSRLLTVGAKVGVAWLVGLGLLLLLGGGLSRLALRAAQRLPTVRDDRSVGLDAAARRAYRAVLWTCLAYGYMSIALAIVAAMALSGGLVYGLVAPAWIPIKLLLVMIILIGVTASAVLRGLFRRREQEPGQYLDCSSEPRLRAVLDEVAGRIDTRPVDSVYLTPGTDVAVMERGNLLRRVRRVSERCLILGVGVLDGMRLEDLKAVLAHEYGHFSGDDTAGGEIALAVRRSLGAMTRRLAQRGTAVWYNPAWLFLRSFSRVFLAVSRGASRLQEVMADRRAASAYGNGALERGLRHVIERSVRFDHHAGATLEEVLDGGKPLVNLYSYRPVKGPHELDLAVELSRAIHTEASLDDSHPSPADRFAWLRQLADEDRGIAADAEDDAWNLFSDRVAIERRMTEILRADVQRSDDMRIGAEDTTA